MRFARLFAGLLDRSTFLRLSWSDKVQSRAYLQLPAVVHREADDNSKAQAEAVLPVTEVRELSGQRRNTRQIRTQVAQDIVSLKNADCEQPAEIYVHATAQSRGKAKADSRDVAGRRGEVRCCDAE